MRSRHSVSESLSAPPSTPTQHVPQEAERHCTGMGPSSTVQRASVSCQGRLSLAACLLAGAIVGGWTAGRFRPLRLDAASALRCLAGGALMGWGSLLIPGSNDGLILVGLPMLWPYAWAAFLTMCVSIGIALWIQARIAARWRGGVSTI